MAAEYAFDHRDPSDFSDEGTWSSDSQTSGEENLSWISWWCAHQGHEYFAEVPEDFIEDDFNMTGLSSICACYREALELILDLEPDEDSFAGAADQEDVEASAEFLYTLIHQRYICSRTGLITMAEKYEAGHFGVCPRVMCRKTAVLPVGLSDTPEEENVKLYCPSCLDIYQPPNSRFLHIDGAYFGTTFPHLFFMTFPDLLPRLQKEDPTVYTPKIYGFNVSEFAASGPRMTWLRQFIQMGRPEMEEEDPGEDLVPLDPERLAEIRKRPGFETAASLQLQQQQQQQQQTRTNNSTGKAQQPVDFRNGRTQYADPAAHINSKSGSAKVVAVRESKNTA